MKKRIIIAATLVATICIGVVGYGVATAGPSEAEQRADARYERAMKDYRADVSEWKADTETWEQEFADYSNCEMELGSVVEATVSFAGRMAGAGITTEGFQDEVGSISADLEIARGGAGGDPACAGVAVKIDDALLAWGESNEAWETCVDDYSCDLDSTEDYDSDYQVALNDAHTAATGARGRLEAMDPGEKPVKPTRPRKPQQG